MKALGKVTLVVVGAAIWCVALTEEGTQFYLSVVAALLVGLGLGL